MKLRGYFVITFTGVIVFLMLFTSCTTELENDLYYEIISLSVSPAEIYADNDTLTYALLSAGVIDEHSQAAEGVVVNFGTDLGTIQPEAVTDQDGNAYVRLNDNGVPGTAHLSVYLETDQNSVFCDSIEIIDFPPYLITDILSEPDTVSLVDPSSLSIISVNVIDGQMQAACDKKVYFSSETGNIQTYSYTDDTGTATAILDNFIETGSFKVSAWIDTSYQQIVNTTITVKPAISLDISIVSVEPEEIFLDDGLTTSMITVLVIDQNSNPVSGEIVHFQTDIGNLINNVCTDQDGMAVTTFWDTETAGIAHITASAGADTACTTVTIISSEVSSLRFMNEEMIELYVTGGWIDFAAIRVSLFNADNQLISTPKEVWFKFLSMPDGTNLNSEVYTLHDSIGVLSYDGIASVLLNSGTQSGAVSILACCENSDGSIVSATCSHIEILAGAPYQCDIEISGMDTAIDYGEGIWQLEIWAYVTDMYDNPANEGTAVYFYLDPNPEYASVIGASYVGMPDAAGDSYPGTAFSNLIFDGAHTNDPINLYIETGSIITSEEFQLPLQYGELTMLCVPTHLDWYEEGNEEDKRSCSYITVHDGQNTPINNQRIMLASDLGDPTDVDIHPVLEDITDPGILNNFNWGNLNNDGNPIDGYTGWYGYSFGILRKYVVYQKADCPPPVPDPPGMVSCVVTAIIADTNISVTQTVTLFRYTD